MQDRARRLVKDPREEDRKEVENLRQTLMSQFDVLNGLQRQAISDIAGEALEDPQLMDDPTAFDDFDPDPGVTLPGLLCNTRSRQEMESAPIAGVVPPECRPLSIPSAWSSQDNPYRGVELELQIKQAAKTLQALQDHIADKSFQYSHVIRVAPRKGVKTRARSAIAKLNNSIISLCRVYARCRSAMCKLGADDVTLRKYMILLKEHVQCSTALVNPNTAGSSRIELSWIWRSESAGSGVNDSTPEALLECEAMHL